MPVSSEVIMGVGGGVVAKSRERRRRRKAGRGKGGKPNMLGVKQVNYTYPPRLVAFC